MCEESNIPNLNETHSQHLERVQDEKELIEDQLAADKMAEINGQQGACSLQLENIEDGVYSVAPGEDNVPKYVLLDKDFEVLAFPDLFPYGKNGFDSVPKRETNLSLRRYYQQRIFNVDGRFAKNIEYLFCAQYASDLKQVQSEANIALRITKGRTLSGQRLNVGMLKKPEVLNNLVRTEQAYKFLRHIRGSPAYWQHELYEVMAMLRVLGIPTWFLTLSAADLHWPEMIQAVGLQIGNIFSDEDVLKMTWKEKSDYLQNNPVTGVRMFHSRTESFLTEYVYSSENPLGQVTDHVIKIEFQARGSPHAHCLLWVKGAPKIDVDSDEIVCAFIDKYVNSMVPPDNDDNREMRNLLLHFETHAHSQYCRRNGKCRFGFTKAPSPRTLISREQDCVEDIQNQKRPQEILSKIHSTLESWGHDISFSDLLCKSGVGEEEYVNCLKISRIGKTVILKRNPCDILTNGCNLKILKLWKGNIDFQFVVDEYSTVMYICGYMMKSEKALGDQLKRVAKESQNDHIKEQLKKIGTAFLGNRVVGAPESVIKLNSMWLIKKSRKVTFVCTNFKDQRVSIPKGKYKLNNMEDDDEDIFMTSIHDRYAARPISKDMMCLAKFAVNYEVVYSNTVNDSKENEITEDNDILDEEEDIIDNSTGGKEKRKQEIIQLRNGMGYMRKRRRESVLRTHKVRLLSDPEKYYHSLLMLYWPWRDEESLKGRFKTYQYHYMSVKNIVDHNAQHFSQNTEHLDHAMDMLTENGPPETSWDSIVPSVEEDNMNTLKDGFHVHQLGDENANTDTDSLLDNENSDEKQYKSKLSMKYTVEARKDIMTQSEYRKHMRNLNSGQKQIVMYNRAWCKAAVVAMRKGKSLNGYHIFLSGPGGTGKSHVINLVRRDIIHFFQLTRKVEPDDPLVLLTAPTGSAAFNISGLTIHSALQLNSNRTSNLSYESKAVLFQKLHQLKLMVIDEISMVGSRQFQEINSRLCKILHGDIRRNDFGGIAMLLVGDLYQLPPVMQRPIFQTPKIKEPGDLAPSPWQTFVLHELTEIMRQKDISFSKLLNIVRMKQPEENSAEDHMLRSCNISVDRSHLDYPMHAMHVFATNAEAAAWNIRMLSLLEGQMMYYCADDSRKDKLSNIAQVVFPDNPRETGNLVKMLKVKIGARVMLTNNIDVTDGLTNAAMGTITHIVQDLNQIKCILVKFDSHNVGSKAVANSSYKHICKESIPINKIQVTFPVRGKESFQGSRCQFPLFLAWAVTIHKCQGLTLDEIVVDMSKQKGKYHQGQAYVALSRVKTFEKLHIVNYDQTQIKVSPSIEDEMNRLRVNALSTTPRLNCHSSNSKLKVAHINIRGLKSKIDDIHNDKDLLSADVICFNETRLEHSDQLEHLHLGQRVQLFRSDRNSSGGGVMIALTKKFTSKQLIFSDKGLEIVGVQLHIPDPINIISVYRSPMCNKNKFISIFTKMINDCCDIPTYIAGDFNEDLTSGTQNKQICHTLENVGFKQHVKDPTIDTGTIIDHVYTLKMSQISVEVLDCYYSDHDVVYSSI